MQSAQVDVKASRSTSRSRERTTRSLPRALVCLAEEFRGRPNRISKALESVGLGMWEEWKPYYDFMQLAQTRRGLAGYRALRENRHLPLYYSHLPENV